MKGKKKIPTLPNKRGSPSPTLDDSQRLRLTFSSKESGESPKVLSNPMILNPIKEVYLAE
jgi:hypothetical protein